VEIHRDLLDFSAVVLGSHLLTEKNIVRRLEHGFHGNSVDLPPFTIPDHIAKRLTWIWSGYFFMVGDMNLIVAYHFSESTWVSYKIWSSMCYTLLISIITAVIIAPHLNPDDKTGTLVNKPDSPQDQTR